MFVLSLNVGFNVTSKIHFCDRNCRFDSNSQNKPIKFNQFFRLKLFPVSKHTILANCFESQQT